MADCDFASLGSLCSGQRWSEVNIIPQLQVLWVGEVQSSWTDQWLHKWTWPERSIYFGHPWIGGFKIPQRWSLTCKIMSMDMYSMNWYELHIRKLRSCLNCRLCSNTRTTSTASRQSCRLVLWQRLLRGVAGESQMEGMQRLSREALFADNAVLNLWILKGQGDTGLWFMSQVSNLLPSFLGIFQVSGSDFIDKHLVPMAMILGNGATRTVAMARIENLDA